MSLVLGVVVRRVDVERQRRCANELHPQPAPAGFPAMIGGAAPAEPEGNRVRWLQQQRVRPIGGPVRRNHDRGGRTGPEDGHNIMGGNQRQVGRHDEERVGAPVGGGCLGLPQCGVQALDTTGRSDFWQLGHDREPAGILRRKLAATESELSAGIDFLKLLFAYDGVMTTAAFLLFDAVWRD